MDRRGSAGGTSASEAGTVYGRSATPSPTHEAVPLRLRSSRSVTGLPSLSTHAACMVLLHMGKATHMHIGRKGHAKTLMPGDTRMCRAEGW